MTNARTARSAREKAAALRAEAARREARRRSVIITASVAAAMVLVVAVVVLLQFARNEKSVTASGTPKNLTNGSIMIGQATAPVTVRVYEDFLCPICRDFEQISSPQLQTLVAANKVKVEYWPVNILAEKNPDQYSTRAANASAAVFDAAPQAWQKFHGFLFANQPQEGGPGLTDDQLIQYAVQAGAPKASVENAVRKQSFVNWVNERSDRASRDGLQGTPTIWINGKVWKETDWRKLTAAVEAAAKG